MSELPQSRIKKIIKLDPEYSGISLSAVQLITKATELFIQDFTSKASIETRRQQRKKIGYEDFYSVVKTNSSLQFLSDVIPKRFKLRDLVENKQVQLREELEAEELQDSQIVEEIETEKVPAIKRQGILAFTSNLTSERETPKPEPAKMPIILDDDDRETPEMDVDKDKIVHEVSDDDEDDDDVMIDS